MVSTPAAPSRAEPSPADLRADILSALAEVRAVAVAELAEELAAGGGDFEIDSREAEAVIAIMEGRYGRDLAKVEDLEPEVLPTVATLAELIHRRWTNTDSAPPEDAGDS